MDNTVATNFNWSCKHTWKRSAKNTAWCLLGCAIGDFGTILFFQLTNIRAAGTDENLILTPHIQHTLEQALEFIDDDE